MIFKLLAYVIPFWLLYPISDGIAFLLGRIIGYRRKVVEDNLRKCFPEKSEGEIKQLRDAFYKNFTDVMLETLKAFGMNEKDFRERMVVTNPEFFDSYAAKGISAMATTSHICNWEWALLGTSIACSTQMDALYKPLASKFFDSLMLSLRTRFGAHLIPDLQVLRDQAKRRNMVRMLCTVADQTPAKEAPHQYRFLNRDTLFFAGPEKLAVAMNMPVIFAHIIRVKRGYYELTYLPVAEPPYDKTDPKIIERYAKVAEANILQQPANWLWSHKRWKHGG